MQNHPYYLNADSFRNVGRGLTLIINQNIADALKRTGKTARQQSRWANVVQVDVPELDTYCDLYYYDTGKIEIQYGSDL